MSSSKPRGCPVCGSAHLDGVFARPCHYDTLVDALGVAPTPIQAATLRWLAQWDVDTVQQIAAMFRQLRERG